MAKYHLTHKEKLSIRKQILNLLFRLPSQHHEIKKNIKIYYGYFNRKLDAFYTHHNHLQDLSFFYTFEQEIDPYFLNLNYISINISGHDFDAPIDFLNMRRKDILNKIID